MNFTETKSVAKDEIEQITEDNTIGVLVASRAEKIGGDVMFDLRRLRRAILAFEEHFSDGTAEVAIVNNPNTDEDYPLLALVPHDRADQAIVLAPRVDDDGNPTTDQDELLTIPDGDEDE